MVHSGSFKKGHTINVGKHWLVSEEKKKNMGSKKGAHNSINTEIKVGEHKNIKTEFGNGHKPWNKDKHHTIKSRIKMSNSHIGLQAMEKHPLWLGGKSFEPYGIEFNRKLKKFIRERDNNTCQECGFTKEQLGYNLHVHHIDYNKKNNNPNNLICLCRNCHLQTNFNRENWTNYFGGKICSGT